MSGGALLRARWARARLFSIVLPATLAASSAQADEKQVCVQAVERAQNERLEGKLTSAREDFVTCARPVCPDAIRVDCTRWINEVESSLPTIVVRAVWPDGRDVSGLTVMLDGRSNVDAAAGRAIALDPGTHTFRFEAPSASVVEIQNTIREGEKNRIVQVTLVAVTPAARGSSIADARSEADRTAMKRPVPTAAFVLGGFAVAGFAGFAYAGLSGTGELGHLRETCAPSCDPSRVDAARREILVGDILGIGAAVAAGIAAWLVLTRPAVPIDVSTR